VNWTQLLKNEVETAYATTARLLDLVDPDSLEWKPESGCIWMTVGQLLKYVTNACSAGCKGFVSGDWALPAGRKLLAYRSPWADISFKWSSISIGTRANCFTT
jgi:hypothetical protein